MKELREIMKLQKLSLEDEEPRPLPTKGSLLFMAFVTKKREKGLRGIEQDEIPMYRALFFKDTQYPVVRLYLSQFNVTTVAATAYVGVLTVQLSSYNNYLDLASMFDEYRFVQGELFYFPLTFQLNTSWSSTPGACVACLDYAVSAPLGSLTAGLAHDEKQQFSLVANSSERCDPDRGVASWSIQPDWMPDTAWTPSPSPNVPIAYLKFFAPTVNSPGNGLCGYMSGWMDVQWRGSAA